MSAKGKHRRPRLSRLTRIAVATGVVTAAVALPATAAQAHTAADAHGTVSASAAAADQAAPAAAEAAPAADHSYQVVHGDTLSKIADAQHVDGGWQKLYQDNRQVVGDNPNLIYPGQKLTVGGQQAEAPAKASRSEHRAPVAPAPQAAAPKAAAPKAETAKPAAPKTAAPKTAETPAAATPATSGYVAPVNGPLGTPYHQAGSNWSSGYHTGVDFVVGTGTSVKAITAGTVVSAGNGGAYGNEVVIKHADGKYSEYAHLSSIGVSVGQTVTAGQQIGLSGATGNVTGPHLHFEVRTGPAYGSDIDPVAYLAAHGVKV
ncbi:LysM peptidoglycan-binding domain-containing M23 family metallopeptidase [Kitasatospora sp. NPDC048540]|uniref:M23 family metallopeptidase n=1 Tax=unclassified Kitasatospora TaxID=2633591 RepID=UPI0005399D22|nr:LysM peptidoglycan-binding domain-containing M23 family metallopeptidase [Kitasatospora sp. MBT63]